jgi:hypothetical protein
MRCSMDCDRNGLVVGIVGGGPVPINSSGQTIFSLAHIEGFTLGAGEEVDKVAGGASGMGVDRIGEVGDWASEGQAAGVHGQDLQQGLWQGLEQGMGTRLVLTRI